jgi:hypothetical protein
MSELELQLREAIFSLQTRKFGGVVEKIVEKILIEFGFIVKKPQDTSYDRRVDDKLDEIKGSRVLGKSVLDLDNDNIIESLMAHSSDRNVKLVDATTIEWDCNIQQIKTDLFDTLWYVLFFSDCVVIFKIDSKLIKKDWNISYSNSQHRGNYGEGQFHITNKNINYHMNHYLVKTITYNEVYGKLSKK